MDNTITTAARRIARVHNANRGMGGQLVFERDGSGGAWYSNSTYGLMAPDNIVVSIGTNLLSWAQAQEMLDEYEE